MARLPERKHTRLKHYDYSQNGMYFLTICAAESRCLFAHVRVGGGVPDAPWVTLTKYGMAIKERLEEMNRVYGHVALLKYVIMPNHIHFIVVFQGNGSMKYIDPYTGIAEPGAFFEAAGFGGLRRIGVAAQLLRTCDSE